MRNMKVSKKLVLGFLVVAILAAIVGAVGIIGMTTMNNSSTVMYEEQTQPLTYISKIVECVQRLRVGMREYALGVVTEDSAKIETTYTTINDYRATLVSNMNMFDETIVDTEARKLFNEARDIYEGSYVQALQTAYDYAKAGNFEGVMTVLAESTAGTNTMVANFGRCMEIKVAASNASSDEMAVQAASLLTLIAIVLVVALLTALVLATYISRSIRVPLTGLTTFMNKAGTTGNLSLEPADDELIRNYAHVKDEIGQCINSSSQFIKRLLEVSANLEKIANGDLTVEMTLQSNKDTMGLSLTKMVDNLNDMFSEIQTSSQQVSTGSRQIAEGSQSLAQGSTEQASAVQQLSASIGDIAEKTNYNASIAREAAELSDTIKGSAQKGSTQMEQMMQAVREINDASQSINTVIKVIDNIAFQTNILALNASVEAARAGAAGRGFAVVAEEVRSLAAKSADAAKDTGDLIENSVEKANLGLTIATETSASLQEIVEGINRSAEIIIQIAQSSDEQANAITQINTGIDQVAQVVQQNSATAEQSAAASQEMSGQSDMLEQLIARFKLRDAGFPSLSAGTGSRNRLASPPKATKAAPGGDGNFGKY